MIVDNWYTTIVKIAMIEYPDCLKRNRWPSRWLEYPRAYRCSHDHVMHIAYPTISTVCDRCNSYVCPTFPEDSDGPLYEIPEEVERS